MVLSIGEILVDIFKEKENETVFPGGAPFNVACNIAHFNGDVSFYGAVGKDEYGFFLKDFSEKVLNRAFIDVIKDRNTTQAVVTLVDGERSFKFIRDNGADYRLDVSDLSRLDLANAKIVHIGSLMLSYKEGRDFYYASIKHIRAYSKALISFDVNYRDDIFSSENEAKKIFIDALKEADIIKFTEEELELLTGIKDIKQSLKQLLSDTQIAVVTLGKRGSVFYSKDKYIEVPSYPLVPVDTTGAGDAFYSYFLFALDSGLDLNSDKHIKEALKRANVTGGLATQKKGAINVVPSLSEIEDFIKQH